MSEEGVCALIPRTQVLGLAQSGQRGRDGFGPITFGCTFGDHPTGNAPFQGQSIAPACIKIEFHVWFGGKSAVQDSKRLIVVCILGVCVCAL